MSELADLIITLVIIAVVVSGAGIIGHIVIKATEKKLDESSVNPKTIIRHEPHTVNVICDHPCIFNKNGICQCLYIKVSSDGACMTRVLDVKKKIDERV